MSDVWEAMKKHEAEKAAAGQAPAQNTPAEEPPVPPAPDAPAESEPALATHSVGEAMRKAPESRTEQAEWKSTIDTGALTQWDEAIVAVHDRGSPLTEEYRSLRTNLLAQASDERFCYVVTSALATEGKTISTINLAAVMAERIDYRTLMIDADLRRGRMYRRIQCQQGPGLADILQRKCDLASTIQKTAIPNLDFLAAGQVESDRVGELLTRTEIEHVISDARRDYDYVLIDTPPINVVSDAGVLGGSVGEALLVVRMNKTRKESVEKAMRLLHAANVRVVGMVLTHRKYHIPNYLYRYS